MKPHPKPKTKRRVRKPMRLDSPDLRVKIFSYFFHSYPFIGLLQIEGDKGRGVEFTAKDARKIGSRLIQFADWAESRKK